MGAGGRVLRCIEACWGGGGKVQEVGTPWQTEAGRGYGVYDDQASTATGRACLWRQEQVRLFGRYRGFFRWGRGRRGKAEQGSAMIKSLLAMTVCQEAMVTNANESAGQRMHEEAADEFGS